MLYTVSAFLASAGGAIADHLWQSTLFASAAAVLSLAFHREEIISSIVRVKDSTQTISITGPVGDLADMLSDWLNETVVDKTGLDGTYAMPLKWTKGEQQKGSLRASLQEQLCLVLAPQSEPVRTVVIHQVKQPGS